MSRVGRVVASAAVVLVLVACGTDDGSSFAPAASAVREAVDAGDSDRATAALGELQSAGERAHQQGRIDDAERLEFDTLVEHSRALVHQLLTPTTEPVAPPMTAPADDDGGDDSEGKTKGKGKGKGKKSKD